MFKTKRTQWGGTACDKRPGRAVWIRSGVEQSSLTTLTVYFTGCGTAVILCCTIITATEKSSSGRGVATSQRPMCAFMGKVRLCPAALGCLQRGWLRTLACLDLTGCMWSLHVSVTAPTWKVILSEPRLRRVVGNLLSHRAHEIF